MQIDGHFQRVRRRDLLPHPPRGGERYAELVGPAGGGTRSYVAQFADTPEFIELVYDVDDHPRTRVWALSRTCAHHDEYDLVFDSESSFPNYAGFWGRVSSK